MTTTPRGSLWWAPYCGTQNEARAVSTVPGPFNPFGCVGAFAHSINAVAGGAIKLRAITTASFLPLTLFMIGHALEATAAPAALQAPPISVGFAVPTELNPSNGGAPQATIQQAAAFAWQEFIAVNWPAVKQTGGINQRDTPDRNCKFGDARCTGPLVWETFRGKVEIFPGQGTPPGYPGAQGDAYLGYDALPACVYEKPVPACAAPATTAAWINLDETDQITLDSMYAGVAPPQSNINSSPQLIRFLAKANRTECDYVARNKWWNAIDPTVARNTKNYLKVHEASPPAGSSNYVSLPNNTIEVKAGWRVLNPMELGSGRFHMARVRYCDPTANSGPCYREDTWGLVALHIIQKTASAPHFVYATFEQADNLLTAAGKPVEDEDGVPIQPLPTCRADQKAPCPTTPSVTLQDTSIVSTAGVPPQVNLVPASAKYCTSSTQTRPVNQLYYQNSSNPALPLGGYICVNSRDNAIPGPIVEANRTAHAAIKAYNGQQGLAHSPWPFYKLVNVQYQAIDKNYAGLYTGNDPNSGANPSSYHLANVVVETNRSLQLFSGGLVQSGYTGANSDDDSQFSGPEAQSTRSRHQLPTRMEFRERHRAALHDDRYRAHENGERNRFKQLRQRRDMGVADLFEGERRRHAATTGVALDDRHGQQVRMLDPAGLQAVGA
ncbi:MAG TPA: hypothetical protein VF169_10940 [Albitalea sp.]|uniref:hypothetical protein n=1 Tax=Piscinibacter sp. TaxID=1903157 RepID=UPI002ED39F66